MADIPCVQCTFRRLKKYLYLQQSMHTMCQEKFSILAFAECHFFVTARLRQGFEDGRACLFLLPDRRRRVCQLYHITDGGPVRGFCLFPGGQAERLRMLYEVKPSALGLWLSQRRGADTPAIFPCRPQPPFRVQCPAGRTQFFQKLVKCASTDMLDSGCRFYAADSGEFSSRHDKRGGAVYARNTPKKCTAA